MKFKRTLYIVIYLVFHSVLNAQTKYTKEVEAKILEVEQHLCSSIFQYEGKPFMNLHDRMAFYGIKGLSIAVIHNYKIEWAKAYGWADSIEKRRATTETIFQAASVSKSVNGMGVLHLVEENELDLDENINTYLKSWKFPYDSVSFGSKISLKNLLSHTGGINDGQAAYFFGDSIPSVIQMLKGKPIAKSPPVKSEFKSGQRFRYTNAGVNITQVIVNDVSNLSYDKYMNENVLKPLGMSNSFFAPAPPKNLISNIATGYDESGKQIPGKYLICPGLPSSGLWTTPTDLCKFILEIELSLIGKSNKVLSREMTETMLKPYIDSTVALGVFVDKNGKYFKHNGSLPGFGSEYYGSFAGGNGVVIMMSGHGELQEEIENSVAVVYQWNDFYMPKLPLKNVVNISPIVLDKYVGLYRMNQNIYFITKSGKGLNYQLNQQPPMKMLFTSDSDFFNVGSIPEKCFYFDEKGKVKGFAKKYNNIIERIEKVELEKLSLVEMKKIVGKYLDEGEKVTIELVADKLWYKWKGNVWEMHFTTKNNFFVAEDLSISYSFMFDKDGKVAGYKYKDGSNDIIAKSLTN